MGIYSGAMTVRRFKVGGELPEGWRETFRDKLNEFGFQSPPQGQGKEEVEGWVQVHNLLDTEFDDFNRWLVDRYAVFALRVDKKRLPARLFKATLEKRVEAWCLEKGVERCPSTVKTDLKEALESEWLDRTLPTVAVTEVTWNLDEAYVIVHGLSEGVAERVKKRFFQTFGLQLVSWSPLEMLADSATVERIMATAPMDATRQGGAA